MHRSFLLHCAVFVALLASGHLATAGDQIFKCVVNGSVTFQSTPCPVEKPAHHPSKDELNAERKKRLAEAAATAASNPRSTAPSVSPTSSPEPTAPPQPPNRAPSYRCDGRLHCSQMRSCTEAKYFLANCPGVKMDGNHDGIPCEQQWCTTPSAK